MVMEQDQRIELMRSRYSIEAILKAGTMVEDTVWSWLMFLLFYGIEATVSKWSCFAEL